MAEEIFRKKSLDKIRSPESLNDYVRVVNPGVWLVLVAAIVLLLGACIWGVFGRVEEKIQTQAVAEKGQVTCQMDAEQILSVEPGMTVQIDETEGTVTEVDPASGVITARMDIADGAYLAYVITESIKPISFLFN